MPYLAVPGHTKPNLTIPRYYASPCRTPPSPARPHPAKPRCCYECHR